MDTAEGAPLFRRAEADGGHSVLLLRGSPVIQFSQQPCMRRRPRITIGPQANQLPAYLSRIATFTAGRPAVFVSLVDSRGAERFVARAQLHQVLQHLQTAGTPWTAYHAAFAANSADQLVWARCDDCTNNKLGNAVLAPQLGFVHLDFHAALAHLRGTQFLESTIALLDRVYGPG